MAQSPKTRLDCDVLVIGGGPAGSTIAALLAEKGRSVILIDKDRHPRFHIGESLLPRNLPIFERLGVLDEVARMAVLKCGADLAPPAGSDYAKFAFREANPRQPSAFQVKRADFDALLLDNARAKGARVLEGTKATRAHFDADGGIELAATDDTGRSQRLRAAFLVDASGRDAFLASQLGQKERDPRHNSAAVFAHFKGVKRRTGLDEGNTSVVWFDQGWFWAIPLPDGNDSIGVVCHPEFLRTRQTSLENFLSDAIASCPQIARRMEGATAVTPVHAAGNYSYKAREMHGARHLLIGDAYAFLDPIFSTGVFLAMESATRGADTVERCLCDPAGAQTYLARHAAVMDRGLQRLAWFIYRFNSPAMQTLFLASVNPLNMRKAVISLLAGDVFERHKVSVAVPAFKLAYHALNLMRRKPGAAFTAP